jgi:hypothetical protein
VLCTGGAICNGGACTCTTGSYCGGKCVNTSFDNDHCGSCNIACVLPSHCLNASCL